MPPSMSDNENDDIPPPLTDEDVNLLHSIVLRAQDLPGKQFEALSRAYDEKLKARGRTRDPDGRFIKFLIRMQDGATEADDLLQRFKDTLNGLGIQVDWDDEDEGIQDITRNLSIGPSHGRFTAQQRARPQSVADATRTRRGSFDSYLDNTLDKLPGLDLHALHTGANQRSRSETNAPLHSRLPLRLLAIEHGGRRSVSDDQPQNPRRSVSESSRGNLQGARNSDYQPSVGYSGDESEQTDSFDRLNFQIPGVNASIPGLDSQQGLDHGFGEHVTVPPGPNQSESHDMWEDAQAFDHQRIRSAVRRYFAKWRSQTQDRLFQLEEMNAKADLFYRRTLCRASLVPLRTILENQRQGPEERLWIHKEIIAEKARELFLVTKAFTHWEGYTRDQIERASTARRHIVRRRYFKAWHAVTAINLLKIRQFVLGKTFKMWRSRLEALRERESLAVVLYEKNRDRRILEQWKATVMENQALQFNVNRLKKYMMNIWIERLRALDERDAHVGRMWDSRVLRNAMKKIRDKLAQLHEAETTVQIFRRQALLGTAFKTLLKQAKLQPLLAQFTQLRNKRNLQSVLQAWHHTAQLSRKAKLVDRERILRNAWTAWNDQLRIKSLESKITDRFAVECLYKWALASRVSLFARVKDRQLKESTFATWVSRFRDRQAALADAEQRFAQFKRTQLLRTHLRKFEAATVMLKDKEYIARSYYEPKLKARMFDKLLDRHDHLQQLNRWSNDARFYVLTTHALKAWKDASQTARRNKRREAYSYMRRTVKLNLVRRTFGVWRDRMAQIQVAERQANELLENRTFRVATEKLAHWHNRTIFLQGQDRQAVDLLATKLMSSHLIKWHQRLQFVRNLDEQAVALRQENTEILAGSYLKKKLGWRIWNIQRQHDTAEALFQRNFEKHMRAMIRFWAEQTAERLAVRETSPTPSRRSRRSRRDDNDNNENTYVGSNTIPHNEQAEGIDADEAGDETRRLEAWTAFDEGSLGLDNLDLSLSLSPQHHSSTSKSIIPPMASRQQLSRSSASRDRNQIPTPRSNFRSSITRTPFSGRRPPSTIPELSEPDIDTNIQAPSQPHSQFRPLSNLNANPNPTPLHNPNPILDTGLDIDQTLDFDLDQATFWTSTPAPNTFLQTANKPGYLKTPSKRSVVRAKRVGGSPEKGDGRRRGGIGGIGTGQGLRNGVPIGSLTAPAKITTREVDTGTSGGGVTSFERRLREGGFGVRGRGTRGGLGGV